MPQSGGQLDQPVELTAMGPVLEFCETSVREEKLTDIAAGIEMHR